MHLVDVFDAWKWWNAFVQTNVKGRHLYIGPKLPLIILSVPCKIWETPCTLFFCGRMRWLIYFHLIKEAKAFVSVCIRDWAKSDRQAGQQGDTKLSCWRQHSSLSDVFSCGVQPVHCQPIQASGASVCKFHQRLQCLLTLQQLHVWNANKPVLFSYIYECSFAVNSVLMTVWRSSHKRSAGYLFFGLHCTHCVCCRAATSRACAYMGRTGGSLSGKSWQKGIWEPVDFSKHEKCYAEHRPIPSNLLFHFMWRFRRALFIQRAGTLASRTYRKFLRIPSQAWTCPITAAPCWALCVVQSTVYCPIEMQDVRQG